MVHPLASGYIVTVTPAVARYHFRVWADDRVDIEPDVDRGLDDPLFEVLKNACASALRVTPARVPTRELFRHPRRGATQ